MMIRISRHETGNILVIDDNLNNIKNLETILVEAGHQVRCASNMRTAFMIIEASCPELILLDIRLPEEDGFAICRQLKAAETTRGIPVIFISAADDIDEIVRGFEAGAVDYIEKPIRAGVVLARVNNHLELSRLQKTLVNTYEEVDKRVKERTRELEATSASLQVATTELSEKTAHLQEAQRIAHVGSWEYTIATGKLLYSAEAERLFGGVDSDLNTFLLKIHPPDRLLVKLTLQRALQVPLRQETEFRVILPGGRLRWLRGRCEICRGDNLPARLTGTVHDITENKKYDELVASIEQSLASTTGQGFFQGLVPKVACILKADYVLAGEYNSRPPAEISTLAVTDGVRLLDNMTYSLRGTPCENVISGKFCSYPTNVQQLFPEDHLLAEMGIQGYVGTPLRNAEGEVHGVLVALYRDTLPDLQMIRSVLQVVGLRVSSELQRRKSQQALEISRKRYKNVSLEFRILLDGIPDLIFRTTQDLRIVWGNAAVQKTFHRPLKDTLGCFCYEVWHHKKGACTDCPALRCFRSGKPEFALISASDGRQWGIKTFPLLDGEGRVESVINIASDITARVKEREDLARSARLASIGELAAGIAHEINNPINGIINYAQLLVDGATEASREQEIAGSIIEEGERIAGIVRALLSFAKDQGEEKGRVDLAEVVTLALSLTLNQLTKDNITVVSYLPEHLPAAHANRQQIQQVLLNLLSNAHYALNEKYPAADGQKRIDISAGHSGRGRNNRVWLEVRDYGTGIPDQLLEKVRDPFFTSKPTDKGTGLGLSISHGIIEAHGGELTISSVENEWTKIRIELPPA